MNVEKNACDDNYLIEAYQKSVEKVNKCINNMIIADDESEESENSSVEFTHVNRIVGSKELLASPAQLSNDQDLQWNAKDFCRVVWTEDGYEYEAVILSINHASSTCLVRFLGYDNVEVHKVKDLKPSLGQEIREEQIEMAEQEIKEELIRLEINDSKNQNPNAKNKSSPKTDETNKSKTKANLSIDSQTEKGKEQNFDPNKLAQSCPFIPITPDQMFSSFGLQSVDDQLSSMLMSWYLCGYHTGRYVESSKRKEKIKDV